MCGTVQIPQEIYTNKRVMDITDFRRDLLYVEDWYRGDSRQSLTAGIVAEYWTPQMSKATLDLFRQLIDAGAMCVPVRRYGQLHIQLGKLYVVYRPSDNCLKVIAPKCVTNINFP